MGRHDRRRLTDGDYESFFDAADARPPKVTPEILLGILRKKSSFRLWRLQYDATWARKQLKKKGFDPDLLREII